MARVAIQKPDQVDDPIIQEIFSWVTGMEGAVPNHFYVELNFPEYLKAKLGSTKVLWEMGELTMEEIQHIGILISRANGCPYCTGAFCTILNYGLQTAEEYVLSLAENGIAAISDDRLKTLLDIALKANNDPKSISDQDISDLRDLELTDKGIVQLIHLVSDFASYNRLNLALDTDYDYRDIWRINP
ncbi:MAG: carboxymuconolactone decarboxylase family protein [Gammaproteobacteria bacterium]